MIKQNEMTTRWQALLALLRGNAPGGLAVALSGGVDSGLLAYAARQAGVSPLAAYTFRSELTPDEDIDGAAGLARLLGLDWQCLPVSVLSLPEVAANGRDRCYHCKRALFSLLRDEAARRGIARVADGSNADDMHVYRPGNRAAAELAVWQPLARAGLSKADIRSLAQRFGLPNHDRPASPCLASRFPYDTRLDAAALSRVSAGESFLRGLGFRELRLRAHGAIARIETPVHDLPRLLAQREPIAAHLRGLGFAYVTLDLDGLIPGRFDLQQ